MCKTIITRTHTNYLTQDASWYKGESGNLVAENFYSADKNLQGLLDFWDKNLFVRRSKNRQFIDFAISYFYLIVIVSFN
jgi:hypothetical protein